MRSKGRLKAAIPGDKAGAQKRYQYQPRKSHAADLRWPANRQSNGSASTTAVGFEMGKM